jgi:hypothetical protein
MPPPPALMPGNREDITLPGIPPVRATPLPSSLPVAAPHSVPLSSTGVGPPAPTAAEARGSILAIGASHIGSGSASGEIPQKVPVGARVLVPGPHGLMQSATVRQLLQGYYELEVGSSGETIWVPMNGVVPE